MSTKHHSSQDSSYVPSIPNLSDENWGTWCLAKELYVLITDLVGIIDEKEPVPPISDTLSTQIFLKRKKLFAGIIGLKLSDPKRGLLVTNFDRRDPVALGKDIKSHSASTEARNCEQVFSKLLQLSCIGNEIPEFITLAKNTLMEYQPLESKPIGNW